MANEEYGESSRKLEPNDMDRPLKKARYVWEVKGKYHLKETLKQNENKTNETDQEVSKQVQNEVRPSSSEVKKEFRSEVRPEEAENQNEIDDTENNNVLINNNQEDCCRESLIAQVDHIMTIPVSSDCDVSYSSDDSSDDERTDSHVPVTLVSDKHMDYNYHLKHWQARHIARGFVDNTINRVIESCGMNNELQQMHYLEICEILKNCTDDVSHDDVVVEDEGIAMAIQSHGLHTSNMNSDGTYARLSCESDGVTNSSKDTNGEDDPCRDHSFNEPANGSSDSGNNTDSLDSISCDSLNHQEQDDFMNAAVSVAIRNKGLSSTYS